MALEMKMQTLADEPSTVVASVDGALTMGTSLKTVDNNLQALVERGTSRLILDLTGCPYCDSAGLGLLMHISGLMAAPGRALRICGASARVLDLLRITRTESLLPLDPDRAASIAALQTAS
jgi:anti-sigma B factor antagonist